jgi:hypothetical protein
MKTATSHVIVLLLGVGLGVLVVHPRPAPARSDVEPRRLQAQPDARPFLVAAAAIPDSEGVRRDVRQILREELRAFVAQRPELGSSSAPATTPTRQNEEAMSQAQVMLQAATGKRTWTRDDARALRQLMPQLTADQQQEVMHTLIPLLNAGDIKVETRSLL